MQCKRQNQDKQTERQKKKIKQNKFNLKETDYVERKKYINIIREVRVASMKEQETIFKRNVQRKEPWPLLANKMSK